MNELKTVAKLVKALLEDYPKTRNSDSYLYLKVLEHQASEKGINLRLLTVPVFLEKMDSFGFSGFETVRRTRQKVQRDNPGLSACKEVYEYRGENEAVFRAFAAGDAV